MDKDKLISKFDKKLIYLSDIRNKYINKKLTNDNISKAIGKGVELDVLYKYQKLNNKLISKAISKGICLDHLYVHQRLNNDNISKAINKGINLNALNKYQILTRGKSILGWKMKQPDEILKEFLDLGNYLFDSGKISYKPDHVTMYECFYQQDKDKHGSFKKYLRDRDTYNLEMDKRYDRIVENMNAVYEGVVKIHSDAYKRRQNISFYFSNGFDVQKKHPK